MGVDSCLAFLLSSSFRTNGALHPHSVVVRVCPSQVDALGRQLARGAADGEELGAQRENLLAELASAQQVRLPALGHTSVHGCKRRCTQGDRHPPHHSRPLAAQVRLLLERNREDLQRQLAVSEGQLGLMQEHLAEARQEVEGLRQRVSLEQGRTAGQCTRPRSCLCAVCGCQGKFEVCSDGSSWHAQSP